MLQWYSVFLRIYLWFMKYCHPKICFCGRHRCFPGGDVGRRQQCSFSRLQQPQITLGEAYICPNHSIELLPQRLAKTAIVSVEPILCLRGCRLNRSPCTTAYSVSFLSDMRASDCVIALTLAPILLSSPSVQLVLKNLFLHPWQALWTMVRPLHQHFLMHCRFN